ncbi:ribonuclease P/MRP protein subunit POP1 [Geosmithia morbida]|uniref:Ribonuclease P/MRP protein subunit POP1 n=1 Tax=Geosmithia morbida TaxID=1094350 RepID=A0A9P4YZF8_9HYPO|nr:ribonuclease P/MRP protein subunit POP1 [Geosmithia morbida]KAF4124571.1 ribonuclease P/MRP protein subunit POP1 [Geosmithia morbida]
MGPKPGNDGGSAPNNKRKAGGGGGGGSQPQQPGRSNKFQQRRAQVQAARVIPAQNADAALSKDGELDLQAFVAAHEFEIRSLEQSMATSKAAGTSRAFQQVPRGLRRRTASHNPKRVPKRLRARALREMDEDNTPTVESRKRRPGTTRARIRAETAKKLRVLAARKRKKKDKKERQQEDGDAMEDEDGKVTEERKDPAATKTPRPPKIRRNALNDPPEPPSRFKKRQLNKTWLPTHAWHAKRARMTPPKEPLWGFSIPTTPNEKIYRPVHRAQGDRGAVVWDVSYVSTIGLYGNSAGMERVLRRIGVSQDACWNNKGRKWRAGSRSWSGMLARATKDGGRRQMCPGTIFWNPAAAEDEAQRQRDSAKTGGGAQEGKPRREKRELFIRVHPASFKEVFDELLRLAKMETPQLYIEDLRYQVGSIDISGPASTEVLLSVLTPYATKSKPKTKHAELFQSLRGLTNPGALPDRAMLGFSIQDPRLRYPPRRPTVPEGEDAEMSLMETIASWPAEDGLRPHGIFDRQARHSASCLPSQKVINRRRRNASPGSFLRPCLADPAIPVVLLASRSGSATQSQGTWTLLAPWACIMPLWYSVVRCPLSSGGNPRFAGLAETRQVAFERGLPWFPADFPATDAGVRWEREQRARRRKTWGRRPKSKRIEWHSVDLGAGRKGEVGDGLACDYECLFQLDGGNVPTGDAGSEEAMDVDAAPQPPKDDPLSSLSHATLSTSSNGGSSSPHSLLTVRISLLSRGTVGPCARIYRLPRAPPEPEAASPDVQVPATIPRSSSRRLLPHDLRTQWLNRAAASITATAKSDGNEDKVEYKGKHKEVDSRKRQLARRLLMDPPQPLDWPKPNVADIGGHHPLVPDAEDLIGFVTTGSYCLTRGRGAAIGSVAADRLEGNKAGRLCIVRNAGENVGWIAKWEEAVV